MTSRKETPKLRVLVVEDDIVAQKMMVDYMMPHGDCDIAIDGEEAIRAFRLSLEDNRPYDLILMDIMMPNINGMDALQKIRELENDIGVVGPSEVKVIMTTALGDPKTVVSSYYKSGATSYLVKPIGKEQLLNEVRNLGLMP